MSDALESRPKIAGFVPKPRTIDITCPWLEPAEGAEPLTATIAVNLTFAQIDYLKDVLAGEPTFVELFEIVTPQVVAWNAKRFSTELGEYVDIPAPATLGADALRLVDPLITIWLATEIAQSLRGGAERAGKSKPSGDTPETSDGDPSGSTPPTGPTNGTKKTRNRKGSPAS